MMLIILQIATLPKGIPWEIIGGGGLLAIVIIIVVLNFLLKWRKSATSSNPDYGERIASNETAIDLIQKNHETARKENREDHKTIFTKLDDMKTDIIKAINGGKE